MIIQTKRKLKITRFSGFSRTSDQEEDLIAFLSTLETFKPRDFEEEDDYEPDDDEYEDLEQETEFELEAESQIASEV